MIFNTVDPNSDRYPSITPYAYTLNNPMKYVDPDGRDPREAGKIVNVNGHKFDITSRSKSNHTGFSKKINDVDLWNKFDTPNTLINLTGLFSKTSIGSFILEKFSPNHLEQTKKMDRFLDAAVSDSYALQEKTKTGYTNRLIMNKGEGFEAEVGYKEDFTRNQNGSFSLSKSTQYDIIKNSNYGKEGESEHLYKITTKDHISKTKNIEYKPAIPRENTNY